MIQIENLYVKMEEAVFSLRGSDQYQRSTCKTLFAASTGSEISWPSDLNIVFNWGLDFFLFKTSFKIFQVAFVFVAMHSQPKTDIIVSRPATVLLPIKEPGGITIVMPPIWTVFITMAVTHHMLMVSTGKHGRDIAILPSELRWKSDQQTFRLLTIL